MNVEDAGVNDELLILLTRHIVDKKRENEYIALLVQQEDATSLKGGKAQVLLKV